ncbi:MAG TPA: penicillin-binding protein 2 [Longimicrobiaceae bacterium]|nr:penicillin-binding protein 2 [Longimicrobiaceae bacterium]
MKLFQPDPRQRRTLGAVFMITLVISTLLTAFFQTQVLTGAQYAARSEENRLRPIKIPAPRGTIYDRNGEVVATSITGYSVALLPASEETIRGTLLDLMPFLGLSTQDVDALMAKRKARPNDLLEVTERATFPQVAAIEERRAAFPNLMIVERPMRYYPGGNAIGHIAGYVGEITREELQQERFRREGYQQGTWIGKAGIEREYELELGGVDGARFVEVDAMGRVVDPRSSVGALAPVPGENLKLTLDLDLQNYIHRIFPDTMKGAVVAMVPSTGEILAMYSHPAVNANEFVGGIKPSLWRALQTDPTKPLLDRTITALYPPASTWKLATAAAGVKEGILKAGSRMPISCTGGMAYAGRYSRCWYRPGHGSLDLAGAIEKSCNVYFYQVGIRLGLAKLTAEGTRMGFNTRSGIDLPGEVKPIFPTGIDWYRERFGHTPTPSEVMSLAIGQGPNSQSVLNMAHFYSAIAGNGTAPEPHLVDREGAGEGPGQIDLGLDATGLQALWDGLAAVTSPTGTAVLSSIARWKVYGKTGTAQNPQGADHGWFVGFSGPPGGHPEIVVAAIIEHGLHGSDVGPIATKAINFYLNKKHGLPFDPKPTLIERWQSQRMRWSQFDVYPAPITPIPRSTAQTASAPAKAKQAR